MGEDFLEALVDIQEVILEIDVIKILGQGRTVGVGEDTQGRGVLIVTEIVTLLLTVVLQGKEKGPDHSVKKEKGEKSKKEKKKENCTHTPDLLVPHTLTLLVVRTKVQEVHLWVKIDGVLAELILH